MGGPFNPKFWENNSSPPFVRGGLNNRSLGAFRILLDFENYEAAKAFSC